MHYTGISIQYRAKPSKDWITITLNDTDITGEGVTIEIDSKEMSGKIMEFRVAMINESGMGLYSIIKSKEVK